MKGAQVQQSPLLGHNVTSLDLAASGINQTQQQQLHSFSDYGEPLVEFLGSLPPEEKVFLVGHSMGGPVISVAMERFPEKIAAAVFATAFMPGPDFSYLTIYQKMQLLESMHGGYKIPEYI